MSKKHKAKTQTQQTPLLKVLIVAVLVCVFYLFLSGPIITRFGGCGGGGVLDVEYCTNAPWLVDTVNALVLPGFFVIAFLGFVLLPVTAVVFIVSVFKFFLRDDFSESDRFLVKRAKYFFFGLIALISLFMLFRPVL